MCQTSNLKKPQAMEPSKNLGNPKPNKEGLEYYLTLKISISFNLLCNRFLAGFILKPSTLL